MTRNKILLATLAIFGAVGFHNVVGLVRDGLDRPHAGIGYSHADDQGVRPNLPLPPLPPGKTAAEVLDDMGVMRMSQEIDATTPAEEYCPPGATAGPSAVCRDRKHPFYFRSTSADSAGCYVTIFMTSPRHEGDYDDRRNSYLDRGAGADLTPDHNVYFGGRDLSYDAHEPRPERPTRKHRETSRPVGKTP